jgi:hypothetical protein
MGSRPHSSILPGSNASGRKCRKYREISRSRSDPVKIKAARGGIVRNEEKPPVQMPSQ